MKTFNVEIEFDSFEIKVQAKNKADAKKKALARLKNKSMVNLIRRMWKTNRRMIDIDEV